jgi:hypothetical protein
MSRPRLFTDPDACAEAILERVGGDVMLGLPLGIGKANHIANALFERARRDAGIRLRIFTALTLELGLVDQPVYGAEQRKRAERTRARFVNEAMEMTLLGEAVSESLDDGQVVSGIGGQHDFIAQAHALHDARAILVLNSTRQSRGRLQSNIRWQAGRIAVPRHLRDMVVTEFGVADLRGRSDRDVIAAMLALADAPFQPELARAAIRAGKLEPEYAPERGSPENTADRIARVLGPRRAEGLFPAYPFGSDLTPVEQRLAHALKRLKQLGGRPLALASLLAASLQLGLLSEGERECLARLGLDRPRSLKEWLWRRRFVAALATPTTGYVTLDQPPP